MWINEETLKTYKFVHEVRADFPEVSLPPTLTDEMLEEVGVFPLVGNPPAIDPITQSVTEQAPVEVAGVWTRQWLVNALPQEQIDLNQAAKAIADAKLVAGKIDALWAAADRYVTGYISGVAIGILTIGVLQQKPKALAVTAWSNTIWTEYYARKGLVTVDSVDNHDFTMFGPMPHSVPELQVESGI